MLIQCIINTIFGASLFINALLFVPQAIKIYRQKSGEGLSLIMFIGFLLIQFSAVLYGFIHHDSIMVVGYLLSMMSCGLVIVLAFVYGQR